MKIPRDLSGADLVKSLGRMEYMITRQTGSHLRLTSSIHGDHHVTILNHDPLRVGTLAAILNAVSVHHTIPRDDLLHQLFD